MMLAGLAASLGQSLPDAKSRASGTTAPPTINVWYGSPQYFGGQGVPQRWVNILGNVFDPDGIGSLRYSLNGGPARDLSVGPDGRRLAAAGDFNIDIPFASLDPGVNYVTILARDIYGELSTAEVAVVNLSGKTWKRSYRLSWGSGTSLMDSAQVVDGRWGVVAGGARILNLGYDRAIAIGDTTWDDYEVTARMTVHRIDSTTQAFGPISGGPALGFLMRWKGHTDQPPFTPPITQPVSGFIPYGAIGWYHWYESHISSGPDRWELLGNNLVPKASNSILPLDYGVPVYMKMRVKTLPGVGAQYNFKTWRVGEIEPGSWLMSTQETLSDPQNGSFLILAHHVDVTLAEVRVEPLGSVTTPALVSPDDGTAGVGLGLTLKWTSVERAGTYQVQVATDSTFGSGILLDDPYVFDTTLVLNNLAGGTRYFWRVNARNPDMASTFSPRRSFTTSAIAPVLRSPTNDAQGQPTTLTLRWSKIPSATAYGLQVAADSTFSLGMLVDDQNVTDTSRIVAGVPHGTIAYWRVRSRNGEISSAYSAPWHFHTVVDAPVLASPAAGAGGQPLALVLQWRPVLAANRYAVQVSTDSLFGTTVVSDTTLTDTLRAVSGLKADSRYFWRARARNTGGWGAYSPPRVFSTIMSPPLPLSPAQAATGIPVSVQMIWSRTGSASSYHLQLGTDSGFVTGLVKNDSSIVDTFRQVNGLSLATRYYWRIAGRNAEGRSPYSPVYQFTTATQLPLQVQLVAPETQTSIPADTARFIWRNAGAGIDRYWFEIAIDPAFTFRVIDSSLTDTLTIRRQLTAGSTYYWRVKARNAGGWGPFSEVRTFTVVVSGVDDESEIPTAFALRQNYPNPFNPSTRITMALPRETEVRVEVFNSAGELVEVVHDGHMPAGYHTLTFDASRLASGVYFYRMRTPEHTAVRRMVLLR
jgi:hypothetical protein